jgi:modulator of FtsH protease
MTGTISYRGLRPQQRVQAHSLFGQTMGYVAATAGLFTLGAYLGRNLGSGVSSSRSSPRSPA